jgi:uncharacterized protein YndB with AHSA1/START domain
MKLRVETELAKNIDDVFAYLADPAKIPEWESNTLECRVEGPVQAGAVARQRIKMMGKVNDVALRIVEHVPGRRVVYAKDDPFPITFGWTLTAEGSRTRVVYDVELQPKGFFKIMAPLMGGAIRKQVEKDMASIAKRIG